MSRKIMPVLCLVLLGVLADTRPAAAADCFYDFQACYYRAAKELSYWDMWLRGLDCEITWVGCVRDTLL